MKSLTSVFFIQMEWLFEFTVLLQLKCIFCYTNIYKIYALTKISLTTQSNEYEEGYFFL